MNDPTLTKLPPHNLDAERMVLSSCLQSEYAVGVAMEMLSPSDFYSKFHANIFRTIMQLFGEGTEVDILIAVERIKKEGGEIKIEAFQEIEALVPTAQVITQHCKIVKKCSQLRKIIEASCSALSKAYDPRADDQEIMGEIEQTVYSMSSEETFAGLRPVEKDLVEVFFSIEKTMECRGKVTGIPSGFVELDRMTSGFRPGTLNVIAARPSIGKTSLGLDIARYASKSGAAVFFFSLEMSRQELITRALCAEGLVNSRRVKTGVLQDNDWKRLTAAGEALRGLNLHIDDRSAQTTLGLRSACRRALARLEGSPKPLVIVDYIQLMRGQEKAEGRQVEMAGISRDLKSLAKDIGAPVIALAQLNRQVEARPDKRPMLSDLRESGAIEQDADLVIFIYRDEYYNPKTDAQGIAELLIRKQRNGPTGDVRLAYIGELTTFQNI